MIKTVHADILSVIVFLIANYLAYLHITFFNGTAEAFAIAETTIFIALSALFAASFLEHWQFHRSSFYKPKKEYGIRKFSSSHPSIMFGMVFGSFWLMILSYQSLHNPEFKGDDVKMILGFFTFINSIAALWLSSVIQEIYNRHKALRILSTLDIFYSEERTKMTEVLTGKPGKNLFSS